jgi:hypothetical protein
MLKSLLAAAALGVVAASPAAAVIMGVSGGGAIIPAPTDLLDDNVTNARMEGFNEAQGVTTTMDYMMDGGNTLLAGSTVNSHMIFLNTQGTGLTQVGGVVWTFKNRILGVMSDSNGDFEAASTGELGAPGTNYTTGPASQVAPFTARGLETNNGTGLGPDDGYLILAPNQIRISMEVTEPGDWVRVVTAVPLPAAAWMLLAGLGGLGVMARKRRAA